MALSIIEGQRLFHGSTELVINPDLSYSRSEVDFGPGFYCTIYEHQAKRWAENRMNASSAAEHFVVSEYRLDCCRNLEIVEYKEPDSAWFKAIMRGRKGFPVKADIVIGPVADGNLYEILTETEEKITAIQKNLENFSSPADYFMALRDIYQKAAEAAVPTQFKRDNQTVFVTPKGIEHLTFCRASVYDKNSKRVGVYDNAGRYYQGGTLINELPSEGDKIDVRKH